MAKLKDLKGEYIVQAHLINGDIKFIDEHRPYDQKRFILQDNKEDAMIYTSELEFKTIYKCLVTHKPNSNRWPPYFLLNDEFYGDASKTITAGDVSHYELVHIYTHIAQTINLDPIPQSQGLDPNIGYLIARADDKIDMQITLPDNVFQPLTQKLFGSSTYLDDIDGNWVAFPKPEDKPRIAKIKLPYNARALSAIYDVFPYRNYSYPSCFSHYYPREVIYNEKVLTMLHREIDTGIILKEEASG